MLTSHLFSVHFNFSPQKQLPEILKPDVSIRKDHVMSCSTEVKFQAEAEFFFSDPPPSHWLRRRTSGFVSGLKESKSEADRTLRLVVGLSTRGSVSTPIHIFNPSFKKLQQFWAHSRNSWLYVVGS
jgi:hypothetical protein